MPRDLLEETQVPGRSPVDLLGDEPKRSSLLSKVTRRILRGGAFEQARTAQALLDNMPDPEPGESIVSYQRRVNEMLQPREREIEEEGTLKQLEPAMTVTLGGVSNVTSLIKPALKFGAMELASEVTGLNKAIGSIENPDLREGVQVAKLVAEGGLASINYVDKIKNLSPVKWVMDAFHGQKRAKRTMAVAKEAVAKTTQEAIARARSEGGKRKLLVGDMERKNKIALATEKRDLERALSVAEKTYQSKGKKVSYVKTKEIREKLPELYRQKSEEYGAGLNELLSKVKATATGDEVVPVIENELLGHGILKIGENGLVVQARSPVTKAESRILSEYLKLKKAGNAEIDLSGLIMSQQQIRPKYGKAWTPSDHLQSGVSEGLSEIIAAKSPEIAKYRSAYAPFLKWKKAMNDRFKPFAGGFENKKGSDILNRAWQVNKDLSTDEQRLMNILKEQTGKDYLAEARNVRKLGSEISRRRMKIVDEVSVREQAIADAATSKKRAIDDAIADKIEQLSNKKDLQFSELESATQSVIDDLNTRRVLISAAAGAAAGGAVVKYILKRISYGIFGATE